MVQRIVLTSLVILSALVCGSEDKVYGGRLAKSGEFPFAVFIKGSKLVGNALTENYGAGILVSLDKVITAAHIFLPEHEITLIAGTVDRDDKSSPGYQERKMKSNKIHSKYVNQEALNCANKYDIASVEPVSPFTLSDSVKLAAIVSDKPDEFKKQWEAIVAEKVTCQVVGWGSTAAAIPVSKDLKVAESIPFSDEKCGTGCLAELIPTGVACVENNAAGDSACGGDSGGPYVCKGYVYGIHIAGNGCGVPGKNSIIMTLGQYIDYFGFASAANSEPSSAGTGSSAGIGSSPSPSPDYEILAMTLFANILFLRQ